MPIVVTPFTEDDKIDVESLHREIEAGIADGVSAFIVPAVASEVGKLTDTERDLVTREVIAVTAGRVPVIAGVSHADSAKSRAFAEAGLKMGADGVLCAVPMAIIEDDAKVSAFLREVAKAGMDMLMVQDLHWNGYGMSLETHLELWNDLPAYRCLKLETVPAGYKLSQVYEATGGKLCIGIGWSMPQLIEDLERGAHFMTTTLVNKPFVQVYKLHKAGRRFEAVALFNTLLPYLAFKHQHIDIALPLVKRYAVARGIFQTARVRPSGLAFDAVHERHARELIVGMMEIENQIRNA